VTSPLQALVVASGLIVLHAPDGHELFVNASEITVLHQRLAPGESRYTEKASCLINTTDGKFITVIESCLVVLDALKHAQQQ
jgi:hypothetical protein